MFALGVLEGGSPKADIVREVAWIKSPRNYADILYVWSLR